MGKEDRRGVEPVNPNHRAQKTAAQQVMINVDHRFARASYLRFRLLSQRDDGLGRGPNGVAGASTVNTSATKIRSGPRSQVQVFVM